MKKQIILLCLFLVFGSCTQINLCEYNGKQIVAKIKGTSVYQIGIRDKYTINYYYVSEYDYNTYDTGDIIKCDSVPKLKL